MTLRTQLFSDPSNFFAKFASSIYLPSDFLGFLLFYAILQVLVRIAIALPQNAKKLPQKEQGLFYGEFISIIHACLANIMVLWCWSEIGIGFNKTNRTQELLVCYNSLSYFIVDTLAAQFFSYADAMSRIHHFCCVVGESVPFFFGYGAGEVLAEISNPCLQTRNTLRRAGIQSGFVYNLLEKTFVVIFLLCRLILSVPLLWKQAASLNCPLLLVFLTGGVCTLSMVWNIQIINKLWKKVREVYSQNGSKPLSPCLEKVNFVVKNLVHDKFARGIIGVYCLVIYFAAPIAIYRLRIFD